MFIYNILNITNSSHGVSSFKCALKAQEGYLYPLEKCLIFIHKPTIYITLDEIREVKIERVAMSNKQRYFEMTIHTKKHEKHSFNNIEKKEFEPFHSYLKEKKLNINIDSTEDDGQDNVVLTSIKNRKAPDVNIDLPSDEDEFDEDFNSDDGGSASGSGSNDENEEEEDESFKESNNKKKN